MKQSQINCKLSQKLCGNVQNHNRELLVRTRSGTIVVQSEPLALDPVYSSPDIYQFATGLVDQTIDERFVTCRYTKINK